MKTGPLNLLALALVAACVVLTSGTSALAATGPEPESTRPNLKPLWSTFPLGQRQAVAEPKPTPVKPISVPPERHVTPVATGSDGSTSHLLIVIAVTTLLAGSVAALGLRSQPAALSIRGKGGSTMANIRRRLRAVDAPDGSAASPQDPGPSDAEHSRSMVDRLSGYSASESERASEGGRGAPPDRGRDEGAGSADVKMPADPFAVGEQVGMVLKSAQEAAVRIRGTAIEEAERLRVEARSTAAAEVAEARRIAEAERADGHRMRAEAEAYAEETRAEADAFAEQCRREAEREAAQIVGDAQRQLQDADVQVAERLRQADEQVEQRLEALQMGAVRYEERLKDILVVFRGMSSQLEDLLGTRQDEGGERADAGGEMLEDVLRPTPPLMRVE
jgi:hypothetical protein